MADETPEELVAGLAEGIKKQRANKLADTARAEGEDAAADRLTGND